MKCFHLFVIVLLKLHVHCHLPCLPLIQILFCMILIVVIAMAHVLLVGLLDNAVPTLMNAMCSLQVVAVISRFVTTVQAQRCRLVTLLGE